jgi:serine/threonine-protein phosphatase CPPED1
MSNRRFFLKNSLAAAVVASISPTLSSFADEYHPVSAKSGKAPKLRFAIASDGHYGQPGTEYKLHHENIVK